MSPHAVNSFVTDLVAMAQAMERVPMLEAQIADKDHIINVQTTEIKQICADLEQSRTYAATLEQRLHDAEVAKDAAETMFLEADEKADMAYRALDDLASRVGIAMTVLEKPKPAPAAHSQDKPQTVSSVDHALFNGGAQPDSQSQGERASHPTTDPTVSHGSIADIHAPSVTVDAPVVTSSASTGQSEPGPTQSDNTSTASGVSGETADGGMSHSSEAASAHGPYYGKRYIDVPVFMTRIEWLAGGGTDEGYDWRGSFT